MGKLCKEREKNLQGARGRAVTEPLLSIVIANYNYGRFLGDAIRSVADQDGFEECELIVVDGGSSDNSVEIIKRYADKIAWWVSERDKGQSNAFNKGFAKAKGKYLTWLNADDLMPSGCIRKILNEMKRHPECQWFTGNCYRFTNDGRVVEIWWGPHWYPVWLQRKNSPLVIFGPSTFFSRKIYDEFGPIDEQLHYVMDNDLWFKFMAKGVVQRRINCFCFAFRMHEGSKTAEFGKHKLEEEVHQRLSAEARLIRQRIGYRQSVILKLAVWAMRILDGSFFRRAWYRLVFTRVRKGDTSK